MTYFATAAQVDLAEVFHERNCRKLPARPTVHACSPCVSSTVSHLMCLGQRYCGRVRRRSELFSCRDENREQKMEKAVCFARFGFARRQR